MIEGSVLSKKELYYYFNDSNKKMYCIDTDTSIIRTGSTTTSFGGLSYRYSKAQSGNYLYWAFSSGVTPNVYCLVHKINLKTMNSEKNINFFTGPSNIGNSCYYFNESVYVGSGSTINKYDIDLNYISSVSLGFTASSSAFINEMTSDGIYLYAATSANGIKKIDISSMVVTSGTTNLNYGPLKFYNGFLYGGKGASTFGVIKYDTSLKQVASTSSGITGTVTSICALNDYIYCSGEGNANMRSIFKYDKNLNFVARTASIGSSNSDNVNYIEGFNKYIMINSDRVRIYNLSNLTLYKTYIGNTNSSYGLKLIRY